MSDGGWYGDPFGRFEYRYFDGEQWTDQVSTGGVVDTDPPVAAPAPSAASASDTAAPTAPPPQPAGGGSEAAPRPGEQSPGGRPKVPWLIAGGVGLAVLVIMLVVVVGGGGDDDSSSTEGGAGGDVAATSVPSDVTLTDIIPLGGLNPDDPLGITASGGNVWVSGYSGNTVVRIDAESLEVVESERMSDLEYPEGIAVTDDAVWVAHRDGMVSRIDPDDLTITDSVEVGGSTTAVAVSDGAVWVANVDDETVSRIDTDSLEVTDTISVGDYPIGLAVTDDAVWVSNKGDTTVSRISLADREVTDTIDLGRDPEGIAASDDAVWVAAGQSAEDRDGTLVRIDLEDLTVRETVAIERPFGVAVSDDSVWVSDETFDLVVRVDLDDETVVETIETDPFEDTGAIAVGGGAVWVIGENEQAVFRIGADRPGGSPLRYCLLSEELGETSDQPSDEDLDAIVEAAPKEIRDDVETVADAVRDDDLTGSDYEEAADNLDEWESDNCDFDFDIEGAEEDGGDTPADSGGGEEAAPALSAEDEAACRYLFDELEAPGGYDPTVVFPMIEAMATDGGEVEAAAQEALASFQNSGSVQPDAAANMVVTCGSVLAEG